MRLKKILTAIFAVAVISPMANGAHAQSGPVMQSVKVKSISGGNFDQASRQNLRRLVQLARADETVLLWVATNAPDDPNIVIGSREYAAQQKLVGSYHQDILDQLGIDEADAKFTVDGPYFAIDATARQMVRLLYMASIKGYWGIIDADSVSGQ